MNEGIHITGIGAVSPAGNTLPDIWKALMQPRPPEPQTLSIAGTPRAVKADILDPEAYERSPEEYFLDICTRAIRLAAEDSGLPVDFARSCILIGSGMGAAEALLDRPALPDGYPAGWAEKIRSQLEWRGDVQWMANACCAAAQAIAYGCELLQSRLFDRVIAGGAEIFSYLVYSGFRRLNALDEEGCRPFHPSRRGIAVGDGAAFFVLERQAGRKDYGRITGQAVTNDAYHVAAPEPKGEQAGRCIRLALERTGSPRGVDVVVAHGTGTRRNDSIEAKLLYELFGPVNVIAPKERLGHTGGASGAFNLLAALGCLRYQMLPQTSEWSLEDAEARLRLFPTPHSGSVERILSNCFAFGGTNVAMVCEGIKRRKDGEGGEK